MATKNKPTKRRKPNYRIAIQVLASEKAEAKKHVREYKNGDHLHRESYIRAWQNRVDSCMLAMTALQIAQEKLMKRRLDK